MKNEEGRVSTFNKTTIIAIALIATIVLGGTAWWIYRPSTPGPPSSPDITPEKPQITEPAPKPEPEPGPETSPTNSDIPDIIEITMAELVNRTVNHIQDTNTEEYESLIGKQIRLTDAVVRRKGGDEPISLHDYWLVLELNEENVLTVFVGFPYNSYEAEFRKTVKTIQVGDRVTVEGEFDRTYPMVGSPILLETKEGMGGTGGIQLVASNPLGRIYRTTRLTKQIEP